MPDRNGEVGQTGRETLLRFSPAYLVLPSLLCCEQHVIADPGTESVDLNLIREPFLRWWLGLGDAQIGSSSTGALSSHDSLFWCAQGLATKPAPCFPRLTARFERALCGTGRGHEAARTARVSWFLQGTSKLSPRGRRRIAF